MTQRRPISATLMRLALLLVFALAALPASTPTAALAATTTLKLSVVSAADGTTPVGDFKYIINIDNTGTTTQRSPAPGIGCSPQDAGYPDTCNWVSIAGVKSSAPIYTQGNQDDFPGGVFTIAGNQVHLPAGRYLISVLADGYKIDGAHFAAPGSGDVTVEMQPYDLPDATVRAFVFQDTAPTNSAPDAPAEVGLAGFEGHIKDYIDEVTTDVYGNPLCTRYQNEDPATFQITGPLVPIPGTGGHCLSDANGMLAIPHLGPNRYALSVVPPNGSGWVQTTTLEGNHDWDAWVMEGSTGYDTEFVVAGEPFPATFFGFVKPSNTMAPGSGRIKGNALAVSAYIPPVGGITGETGLLGAKPKDKNPIKSLYVSLSDLNNNDQTVYMKHFDCSGVASGGCPFDITGVPDGDYVLGIWDEPQDYIFGEQNVSVRNGELVDVGSISMLGWWTTIEGHVFKDLNENGKMDPGEPGIPNFPIVMRTRENSIMDRGTVAVNTDASGYYWMESAYPITQWLVEEAYADGFQTTGITYQADNQPEETTLLGAGVDINVHPVIGLGGRMDWGVKAYAPGTNGGIVGTLSYDTTRNELNPQYAAIEDWQPSISGLNVDLYATVACEIDPDTGEPLAGQVCDQTGSFQLAADGSYKTGNLLNQYVSETWERPTGCIARNVDGNPLAHGTDEKVLPLNPNAPCLEAPMMGVQFGDNFGATVDGNYGFADGCFGVGGFNTTTGACADGSDPTALPSSSDYLVKVEVPEDDFGRPQYQVTREEDINIANGDSFVPQVPPPDCAGALHTVDVANSGASDNYPAVVGAGYDVNGLPVGVTVPASSSVDNPTLADDLGGTIYEGQQKPLCDTKLVHLGDRKSIAPGFNFFTDVPLPGRFWGLTVDDLNFSSDPKSQAYGEKQPVAFNPVGIYDYTNRLIYTVESDYNGLWDVLLPSTNRISCPTPSGVCANLYRFVGNDPGTPGHWNPNYDPQYRTIAAEFEAFPGLTLPADLAPFPVAVAVQIPGSQARTSVACALNDTTGATPATNPEFFAISKPYMYAGDSARTFTLTGLAFGGTAGSVMLDNFAMTINAWNDTSIRFTVPSSGSNAPATGPHQLIITTAGGKHTVNALTFHVVAGNSGNSGNGGGNSYNARVFEVGVGKTYDPTSPIRNTGGYEHALQDAINAAANVSKALVVVYPGPVDATNPRYNGRGAYYENIVIHSPVKLQGVGPGGVYSNGTPVQGSILDGIGFGGDTALADGWRTLVGSLTWAGNQDVADGEVIYVLPANTNQFGSNYRAAIDGLDIRGGDQMGFPGNLNAIFGGFPGPAGGANAETQGGAIFANAFANNLQITNNIMQNNGGTYGAIRIGTPNIDATTLNHNYNIRIANNRIIANGGTNLAGAIGLFGGSSGYEIASNDVCGSFSAEYGGAISHFGLSPNGSIHDNRIYFNHSYDEGGGIMIAGELATNPTARYGQPGGPQGSGAVSIYNNLIQGNMSEDDGGGLRFLMAGNFPMNVYNNMIVNNIATHEGGGVALDDAPNVRFFNNTVMNNKTTATAITSDGLPAPAGLSTGQNSAQLQPTLPSSSPLFSNPLLFNDIFWENWAGAKGINTVTGITQADAYRWDMGVLGTSFQLSPTNSVLQSETVNHNDVIASATNRVDQNPLVNSTLDIPVSFTSWRTNINFIGAIMVTADLPPQLLSDYHLSGTSSSAYNAGAASKTAPSYQPPPANLAAPTFDIDNQTRPQGGGYDVGADEILAAPAAVAGVAPTSLAFGNVTIGATSAAQNVTLSNTGNATLTGINVVVAAPYSRSGGACGATLNAGASCTISVVFSPTAAGAAAGSVTITANVAVTGSPVALTGAGVAPLPLPTLGLLDNFNRSNANTLNNGTNWSQVVGNTTLGCLLLGGGSPPCAAIRVVDTTTGNTSTGVANAAAAGQATWNNPTSGFGTKQGAAFTFANTTLNNAALMLKATGSNLLGQPTTFIQVRYNAGSVIVETTTNSGTSFTTRGTLTGSFANGDTLTAVANADGSVDVWKTTAANVTTYLGKVAGTTFTGSGRIGVQLPNGARVDNFKGGNLP